MTDTDSRHYEMQSFKEQARIKKWPLRTRVGTLQNCLDFHREWLTELHGKINELEKLTQDHCRFLYSMKGNVDRLERGDWDPSLLQDPAVVSSNLDIMLEQDEQQQKRIKELEQKLSYTESNLYECRIHRDGYKKRLKAAKNLIFDATPNSDPDEQIDKMLKFMEDTE